MRRGARGGRLTPRLVRGLCVLVACGVIGCAGSPALPDIVVILVDTLRADALGAYGSTRGSTPFLDSLAARSYVFDQAYSQSSWTNPAVASLFTSRYQSQHNVRSFGSHLGPSEVTLAALLRERGYVTGAFTANALIGGGKGFEQGFDEYRVLGPELLRAGPVNLRKQRAEAVDAAVLAWLDGARTPRRPLFLYFHYVEPHIPYSPPEAFLERARRGRPRPDLTALNVHMSLVARLAPTDDRTREELELVYEAEVMSLDATLRELFAQLERRGVLRNAVVVVTSDHGEEFGDHGGYGHGHTLYNELIRIPLILHTTDQPGGHRLPEVVSLVDVAPTLLDFAGMAPPPAFEGRSLRPAIRRGTRWWARAWERPAPIPAFSELLVDAENEPKQHEYAVVMGTWKLIVGPEAEAEVYDLAGDAGEQRRDGQGPSTTLLRRALTEFRARTGGTAGPPQPAPLDPDTERQMRALGYVN